MLDLSNENVIHIIDGDIEYLQFRRLLEYEDKVIKRVKATKLAIETEELEEDESLNDQWFE